MTKKYLITVVTQDNTIEFYVRAKSQTAALEQAEKEWDKKYGQGDFDKQTVGIHG